MLAGVEYGATRLAAMGVTTGEAIPMISEIELVFVAPVASQMLPEPSMAMYSGRLRLLLVKPFAPLMAVPELENSLTLLLE